LSLRDIAISGLRGFADRQRVEFAIPMGAAGSGLTVIVGPNGGGKSTVLEALRAAGRADSPSFSTGVRNDEAGDEICIEWTTDSGAGRLHSLRPGSSETVREPPGSQLSNLMHVPSRRAFNPYFSRSSTTRVQYTTQYQLPAFRSQAVDNFSARLMSLERDQVRQNFDELVARVVGAPLDWSIDQQDSGQYFLKVRSGRSSHSSDGLGEGTVSLLFIVDALYDSHPGDIIVIDEPELSLHPIHQRRLQGVLSEYAESRQIIVATHSPYFVNWNDLARGGSIHRVFKLAGKCMIATASRPLLDRLARLTADINNPHVLGTNAAEVFFLEDNVVLVEGQEDVVVYSAIASQLDLGIKGTFFGWGVGGAEKMPLIVDLLSELGYQRVAGILDGNRSTVAHALSSSHPEYRFLVIPTDDVRSKPARPRTNEVLGLADTRGRLRAEYQREALELLSAVNSYFDDSPVAPAEIG
jgi:ABC-type lipoprotein export system ATPase subunit